MVSAQRSFYKSQSAVKGSRFVIAGVFPNRATTFIVNVAMLGCCLVIAACGESPAEDAAWQQRHQQAVNRPRRLIFNNDGNEPVYLSTNATAAELLRSRTGPLAGSQVDSIFYCTWSSGFGMFTHLTKVGQVFTTQEGRFTNNLMPEFLRQGIDPLQVMVEFARKERRELFWSFRVNDTHDGSRTDYGPVMFRANKLKQAHPEWLIGSADKPPKYGSWSAVDFGVPEIRDLAFRYCEEVGRNYDVDGIELDFFRHAFLFRRSGRGEPCSEVELNQLTDLMRRIRAMTEATGRKRKRPILLAIRVPDSVEYCKMIGIDLEAWLKAGLVDLLIVGGYTQLNPWEHSVRLGRRYGVKVYPSLDESRVRDEAARTLRSSPAAYRGRALNVWASGADGVYLFNFFNPHSSLWRELGDPNVLRKLERTYFASVRGASSMPVPHQKFLRVPTLNPASPVAITPGKPGQVEFGFGEDPSNLDAGCHATLRLQFKNPPPAAQPRVELNGKALPHGRIAGDWLEFRLPEMALRKGTNALAIACAGAEARTWSLLDLHLAVVPQ